MAYDRCPNCDRSLRGLLSAVLLEQSKTDFINKHTQQNKKGYCNSCSDLLLYNIADNFRKQKQQIENKLSRIIHAIPILTSPAPVKWEYEVIGMVTAQTTSGTGFATELSRSFNDLFGSSSRTTNRKIAAATDLCAADLRVQCVQKGGNAIISTDTDFAEIGSGVTNMLMVCMAGTAIRVTDTNYFNPRDRALIAEVIELTEQLEAIAVEAG